MTAETTGTTTQPTVTRPTRFGASFKHPLRWLPAAALVIAGAAHVPVIPAHLHEAPYIGILFIVLAVGSLVLAGVITFYDVAAAYVLTAVMMALALVAYIISRTFGLPLIGDDVGNWLEPLGVVAVIAELVACVAAIALSRKFARQHGPHTSPAT
ncbi:hypothetical protein IV498_16875 [Paenarthrobacter sp. Z7-10]|uniref:hypothetical protein n=1 Tax=Paenarthrobacter sp. Z7-10 TaxID=2787635 RepID=UPI0022A9A74C|nr:hypothetical protein [Paenarthrobacter sp. Z7-10]MCZ2404801.1 hypothetical protein [Paenarthrobacter sp. Z7-10]